MATTKKNKQRHLELSSKFAEMGHALLKEGDERQDYSITQIGTVFLMLGGVMLSEEDIFLVSEFCSMFSAKKVLLNLDENNKPIFDNFTKDEKESFDDFISRINAARRKNGLGPIG